MGVLAKGAGVIVVCFAVAASAKGAYEATFGDDNPQQNWGEEFVGHTLDSAGSMIVVAWDKVIAVAQDPATQDAVAKGTRDVIDGAGNIGVGILRGVMEESPPSAEN